MSNPFNDIRTRKLPGLGRKAQLTLVLSKIERGEHVSVVSPRYMGKSCFLRGVANEPVLRERFSAIGFCDVRHESPANNEAFFTFILNKLGTDPQICGDWKDFTKPEGNASAWSTLYDLGMGLAGEDARMLVILDGLDDLALSSQVDEAAWNNLNSLIDTGGVQFITASCDELGDILLDPESRGSLFFQRFQEPVRLPPIDSIDLSTWLVACPCGIQGFDKGAQEELLSQTGGHPKLLAAVLAKTFTGASCAQVTDASNLLVSGLSSEVQAVFNELSLEAREALSTLDEPGRLTPAARKQLLDRGFVKETRADKVNKSCRIIARLAEGSRPGESTMRDLFGSAVAYFKNTAHALKLRMAEVAGGSQHVMFRHAAKMIDNLDHPTFAMSGGLRPMEDEAARIIETLVGNPFPKLETSSPLTGFKWKGDNYRSHNARVVDALSRPEACLQKTQLTRAVGVLFNTMHDLGNYAAHLPKDQPIMPGVAYALATVATELVAEMKRSGMIH